MLVNPASGTCIDEVSDGIYRISTPLAAVPGGFSFNQYLIVDEICSRTAGPTTRP